MFDYPIEKYRFYVNEKEKTVYAISTFAGKIVRGIAKCAPEDNFDVEFGKRLAASRCNMKVAKRRLSIAKRKYNWAKAWFEAAEFHLEDMAAYMEDATTAFENAKNKLNEVENNV